MLEREKVHRCLAARFYWKQFASTQQDIPSICIRNGFNKWIIRWIISSITFVFSSYFHFIPNVSFNSTLTMLCQYPAATYFIHIYIVTFKENLFKSFWTHNCYNGLKQTKFWSNRSTNCFRIEKGRGFYKSVKNRFFPKPQVACRTNRWRSIACPKLNENRTQTTQWRMLSNLTQTFNQILNYIQRTQFQLN